MPGTVEEGDRHLAATVLPAIPARICSEPICSEPVPIFHYRFQFELQRIVGVAKRGADSIKGREARTGVD